MPQNDQPNGQVGAPRDDQGRSMRNLASPPPRDQAAAQLAAADIIRGQLDSLFNESSSSDTPAESQPTTLSSPHTSVTTSPHDTGPQLTSIDAPSLASAETTAQTTEEGTGHGLRTSPPEVTEPVAEQNQNSSPYHRTMSTSLSPQQQETAKQWQQYHTAWQTYYQQYYERYYLSTLQSQRLANDSTVNAQVTTPSVEQQSVSQQDAISELRSNIRQKVTDSADKIKSSRHFMPAIAGISVLLIFMFLQYNRVIFGTIVAYASPGNINPQNIIVDPTTNVDVGPEPRMIIPKINVDAPVVYGVGPDHNSQMTAMESGIAHFSIPGANAVPGQIGNTVMAAHSSNDVFAKGDYKFVFAQNEKLAKGDIIHMNYQGVRYTYSVTNTEVVLPTEVSKIQLDTDKPMLTLISCVPLGTAQKRLLIFAEQVSPDPDGAQAAADSTAAPEGNGAIPGEPSPSVIERLFGSN